MVTFVLLLTLSSLLTTVTFIDLFMYGGAFFATMTNIMMVKAGTNEWMVYTAVALSFVYCIRLDYKGIKKVDNSK
ncbi:hypothetical protein LS684_02985 [Cytobacillus spongiae]|uniref:hypothetical protein n=1 Tax=Cytobacillus spongiae TaxID=2901381 RepID=UPI001F437AB3|nr:hypothetical protein [Cytobacillus spongiae]UII56467.1 hypothetical protein LS684_02985 [Cytobacillus spongiae]